MQMICARRTILFRTRKTELTPATDPTREPNPNESANLESCAVLNIRTQRHDPTNSLMPANMRELDFRNRTSVWTGGCS